MATNSNSRSMDLDKVSDRSINIFRNDWHFGDFSLAHVNYYFVWILDMEHVEWGYHTNLPTGSTANESTIHGSVHVSLKWEKKKKKTELILFLFGRIGAIFFLI